jgi:protein-disulfide isomerase
VKLIEYGSRTCPHCAHFDAEGLPALKAKYIAGGQVSYEFREFPVHGAVDMAPILLGQCIGPARFFPLLSQMMAAQKQLLSKPEIPQAEADRVNKMQPIAIIGYLAHYYGYDAFVVQHGVPAVRARACLADTKALGDIARNTDAAGTKYNVQSTPTFIVNGQVAQNSYDWAALEPVLRAAGAK